MKPSEQSGVLITRVDTVRMYTQTHTHTCARKHERTGTGHTFSHCRACERHYKGGQFLAVYLARPLEYAQLAAERLPCGHKGSRRVHTHATKVAESSGHPRVHHSSGSTEGGRGDCCYREYTKGHPLLDASVPVRARNWASRKTGPVGLQARYIHSPQRSR